MSLLEISIFAECSSALNRNFVRPYPDPFAVADHNLAGNHHHRRRLAGMGLEASVVGPYLGSCPADLASSAVTVVAIGLDIDPVVASSEAVVLGSLVAGLASYLTAAAFHSFDYCH